jgi:hypothetical protein
MTKQGRRQHIRMQKRQSFVKNQRLHRNRTQIVSVTLTTKMEISNTILFETQNIPQALAVAYAGQDHRGTTVDCH